MTAEELWQMFTTETEPQIDEYDAWSFGTDADLLAALVVSGTKTATSSSYPLYELENESLPEEGEYSVILDSENNAVCIIQTKKTYILPFDKITKEFAYKEGEGDRSLEYWRKVHEEFFTKCLKEYGIKFSYDMKVVCEEFEVVFKP